MEQTIRIKQTTKLFTLASVFAVSATSLQANEEGSSTVAVLPTTEVTAPRFMEIDLEIASRVQLIDSQDIVDSGATDLVELLRKEANLHFRSTSSNTGQSQVAMGGFGENSGQRVLVLLDGQRLNTADLAQINWLSIPLALVESVEVIKGGQSALYGNNAISGVIKITTRRPTETLYGNVQSSIGNFDSFNARIGISGREGSIGFSAHAEHDETDGYRDNSQYEADGAGLKLDWNPNDWFSAYGSVSAVESEYGLPGPISRAEFNQDPRQSNEEDNYGEEDAFYYRGGLAFCLGDLWTLALDGGYTDREFTTLFFYDIVGYPYFRIDQEYEILSLSPSLTFQNDTLTAVLGVDYIDDEVDAASSDLYSMTPYSYERETVALFGSFNWSLGDDWILTGSLRFEDAETEGGSLGGDSSSIDDDEYAWSLGAVYFVDSSTRVYGTVRRFYRYPAADEVIDVFSGPMPIINFSLLPESGHEVELGGDWTNGKLTLGGRTFYQWMEDEIILDTSIGPFGATINLDETSRYGVDLDASYALNESLDISFNYSWVRSEINGGQYSGSEIPLAPEHKARVAVEYRPSEPFVYSVGATYTHDVYIADDFANARGGLDDYILFDLNVRYQFSEKLAFFMAVENLLDKEYVSTAFREDSLYPGAGRSAKIGVNYTF